jgi:hypothetical protein
VSVIRSCFEPGCWLRGGFCQLLCDNIVVHQSHIERGIEPVFWPEERTPGEREGDPTIPRMRRRLVLAGRIKAAYAGLMVGNDDHGDR